MLSRRVISSQRFRNGSSTRSQQRQRSRRSSRESKRSHRNSHGSKGYRSISREPKDIKDAVYVLAAHSMDEVSLLNQIGLEPKVVVVNHETYPPVNVPVEQLVEEESAAKAQKVAGMLTKNRASYDVIIGCEAAILLDEEVIGKPKDADDALSILSYLNNRWHTVFTGVTIIDSAGRMKKFHVKTDVKFGDYSEEMFWEYIKTGECFNRVGAYNIHGKGAEFVESIEGTFPGIPAYQLKLEIRELLSSPKYSSVSHQHLPRVSTSATPTVASIGRLDRNNNNALSQQRFDARDSRGFEPPLRTPPDFSCSSYESSDSRDASVLSYPSNENVASRYASRNAPLLSYASNESVASSRTPQLLSCTSYESNSSRQSTGSERDVECAKYDGTNFLNRNLRSPSEVLELRGYSSFVDGHASPAWTKTTGLDVRELLSSPKSSSSAHRHLPRVSTSATSRLGTFASVGRLDRNNNDASSQRRFAARDSRGFEPPLHATPDFSCSSYESSASRDASVLSYPSNENVASRYASRNAPLLSYPSNESVASARTPQLLTCSSYESNSSRQSTGSERDGAKYDGTNFLNRNLRSPSEILELRGYPSFVDGPASPAWTRTTGLDVSRFENNGNGSNNGGNKAAAATKNSAKAKYPKRK